jgi:DNA-binding beta-propeller fold protein YncE
MKKIILFTILSFSFLLVNNAQVKSNESVLKLTNTIVLPNVKGGFDLMAADVSGKRLFVAAQDNHTLEVIDLQAMKALKSVPNFAEPKWVVYRPESNRLYVATAIDGKVTVLDSRTYKKIKSFNFKEKCNNLRFDATKNLLYVGVGNTFGSIGIIDVTKDKIVGEIALSNYPKQFELVGNKMYINVPETNTVEVADLTTRKVIASWKVKEAKDNVPMAIDRKNQRLFIGCEPGKLITYDLKTEKVVSSIAISKEADGIYYDAKRSQIYISCAEGFIDVIKQLTPNSYKSISKIPTVSGAGTSLFIPDLDIFVLAVPQNDKNKAEMRVYKPLSSQSKIVC